MLNTGLTTVAAIRVGAAVKFHQVERDVTVPLNKRSFASYRKFCSQKLQCVKLLTALIF